LTLAINCLQADEKYFETAEQRRNPYSANNSVPFTAKSNSYVAYISSHPKV
jgi:hypothetical protein